MKIHQQFGSSPKRPYCRVFEDARHPETITTDPTKVTCKKCLSMMRRRARSTLKQRLQGWEDGKEA